MYDVVTLLGARDDPLYGLVARQLAEALGKGRGASCRLLLSLAVPDLSMQGAREIVDQVVAALEQLGSQRA